jgi:hypothetical protein
MRRISRSLYTTTIALTLLSGCVNPKDFSVEQIERAEISIKASKFFEAVETLQYTMIAAGPNGDKARALIKGNVNLQSAVSEYYKKSAENADNISRLATLKANTDFLRSLDVITEDLASDLKNHIGQIALGSVQSGKIQPVYSDDYEKFDELRRPEIQSIIFNNSLAQISKFGSHVTNADLQGVASRASSAGSRSSEFASFRQAIGNINASSEQIKTIISPLFPEEARRILADRSLNIYLSIEPDDRLLFEDIASKIRFINSNITVSRNAITDSLNITVKRLQWDEKREPDRVTPIVYSQSDVNLFAAALLMPRNASYLYDLTTGGAEISYAFEVKIIGKGSAAQEELIRNRVSRTWNSCSNARIQNAFGGVQRADFVANQHMQQMCRSSGGPIGFDTLRGEALDSVVGPIRRNSAVARVANFR